MKKQSTKVYVSKDNNKNWQNNLIQFPRLIAEAEAVGCFEGQRLHDLTESMDLTTQQVCELIDRAVKQWDSIKLITPTSI